MVGIKSIVLVSALGMMPRLYDITGMSTVPSFMPVGLTPYSDKMTFMERVVNFNLDIVFQYYKYTLDYKFWKLFNDKIPGFPDFEQIYNVSTILGQCVNVLWADSYGEHIIVHFSPGLIYSYDMALKEPDIFFKYSAVS
ncbi:hypothetical protein ANCCAN_29630 [Ancylostoma caninum]|uniref:Uncharacterized protein n=1 Tax=Ancylostoma caninum TaxID=29170 RepID=A0A368F0W2_ANCCA|nr:hypothetical protein ANCCAN_29630 [Ancylostoma caninum]